MISLGQLVDYDGSTMKRIITAILFVMGIGVLGATSAPAPAQAQVPYCGYCCGSSPYGAVRVCTLVSAVPCGNACWCNNAPGTGFACP